MLYTSHYMEEVQAIASRIVIMDLGRVIASGTLEELTQRIQHEETVRITMANADDTLTERLRAIQDVKSVTRDGMRYTIISGSGSGNLNRVLTVAQQSGAISDIITEKPTLEDVFLTLTGKKLRDQGVDS